MTHQVSVFMSDNILCSSYCPIFSLEKRLRDVDHVYTGDVCKVDVHFFAADSMTLGRMSLSSGSRTSTSAPSSHDVFDGLEEVETRPPALSAASVLPGAV